MRARDPEVNDDPLVEGFLRAFVETVVAVAIGTLFLCGMVLVLQVCCGVKL